jgi:hypothetical protein
VAQSEADQEEILALQRQAQKILEPLNNEIRELVIHRGDRKPDDLVPDVEAIMRRYGVLEPVSREGIVLWIDEVVAESRPG